MLRPFYHSLPQGNNTRVWPAEALMAWSTAVRGLTGHSSPKILLLLLQVAPLNFLRCLLRR